MKSASSLPAVCLFALCPTITAAQDLSVATHYTKAPMQVARGFLNTPAGTIGLIGSNGCSAPKLLTGKNVYLVQQQIYWGLGEQCIRIVVNHRGLAPTNQPSYLGVQIIGFYPVINDDSVTLRREGRFTRNGTALPSMADRSFTRQELTLERFDELHSVTGPKEQTDAALDEMDRIAGRKWHGVPEGGSDDSWELRYQFRSSNPYQTQLNLTHKVLENRLIRMVPYPSDGTPPDGPLAIDIRRKGAQAIAARIFSPVSSDYGGNFALVYSSDRNHVVSLVRTNVAGGGFFNWFR